MTSSDYKSFLQSIDNHSTSIHESLPKGDEIQWQARWFSGAFGRQFKTTDQRDVCILDFGEWNREAGPDFSNACILLDSHEVRGSIEVDLSPSGWEQHGHATNPNYNSVVLHVFIHPSKRRYFSRNSLHHEVPQICLTDHALHAAEWNAFANARPGRCVSHLYELSDAQRLALLTAAAQHRFENKGVLLETMIAARGSDAAIYEALAIALGYKNNKLPFQLLAQRVPLSIAASTRGESILFGVAGFLERPSPPPGPALDVTTILWESWWKQRASFANSIIPLHAWKLAGLRPANHPLRRIAALHAISLQWKSICTALESADFSILQSILSQLKHAFWSFHTSWKSPSRSLPLALLGPDRIRDIYANIALPLAFVRNNIPPTWQELPASAPNASLAIAATRIFGMTSPPLPHKLFIQQALLQIYQDFCLQDHSSCERCNFPNIAANWKTPSNSPSHF